MVDFLEVLFYVFMALAILGTFILVMVMDTHNYSLRQTLAAAFLVFVTCAMMALFSHLWQLDVENPEVGVSVPAQHLVWNKEVRAKERVEEAKREIVRMKALKELLEMTKQAKLESSCGG